MDHLQKVRLQIITSSATTLSFIIQRFIPCLGYLVIFYFKPKKHNLRTFLSSYCSCFHTVAMRFHKTVIFLRLFLIISSLLIFCTFQIFRPSCGKISVFLNRFCAGKNNHSSFKMLLKVRTNLPYFPEETSVVSKSALASFCKVNPKHPTEVTLVTIELSLFDGK